MVVHHDIGRYSVIAEAPGCFGTNERMVEFKAAGRKAEVKNAEMESVTSTPIIDQATL